jgi:hypothetical protein
MREIKTFEWELGFGWVVQEDGKTIAYGWEKTSKAAREAADRALEGGDDK